MNAYLAHIRNNLRLLLRDRTVLFFNLFFPLVFFIVFANVFQASKSPAAMAQVICMVLIIGILGSGFFGAGIRAVQERESNVLRRFKVAPVGAAPIIVASMVGGLVAFLPTVFFFFLLAALLFHFPPPHNLLSLLLFVCLGSLAFRAVGMIIAAVVNSPQESQIIIQLLYLPMLFLSGATFPVSIMPAWVQTAAQFLPATYLFQGMQNILINGQSVTANAVSAVALVIAMLLALLLGAKLFRWEKGERIQRSAKLWLLAVLSPFVLLGLYQARTKDNLRQSRIMVHRTRRSLTVLYQNARVFVGDGAVIPNGAVLVRNGRIDRVFTSPPANPQTFNAEVIDASGKTIVPGLIDMHVHLGAPGGMYADAREYANPRAAERELAAYLYSGVTAVRSTGDALDRSLALRSRVNSGEFLGAELFVCGPMFTAPGGHGTEYTKFLPQNVRRGVEAQLVRVPATAEEARAQVEALKRAHVDGVKAILETGGGNMLFNRLDTGIYRALVDQAKRDALPVATHTGSLRDVADAVEAGTSSIEHGSFRELIGEELFGQMKRRQIAYDPTLSVLEAENDLSRGRLDLLDRPLVQQVAPRELLQSTRLQLSTRKAAPRGGAEEATPSRPLNTARANLVRAFRSGVRLVAGSDAGNLLVIHGPTIQRELQLWVQAGIPPAVALQAATYHAAETLHAEGRIGLISKGHEATFLLLDGDPVADIANLERVAIVVFRGERVDRASLFNQNQD